MKRYLFYFPYISSALARLCLRFSLAEVNGLSDRQTVVPYVRLLGLLQQRLKLFSGKEYRHPQKFLDQFIQVVLTLTSRALGLGKFESGKFRLRFAIRKYQQISQIDRTDDFVESLCCQHF